MNYWSLMENPWLAAFVSFMIGFGIAAMFRPLCNGPECYVIHGPPVAEVINKVYQMGERCVEFSTEVVDCPKTGTPDAAQLVHTVKRVGNA
jgi:hypothetical protein